MSGSATLTIATDPPQPNQPIYRWLVKDGVPLGTQPTEIAQTGPSGTYSVTVDPIPADFVGTYSQEQYAVGDVNGPRSPALEFTVTAPPLGAPSFESIEPNTVETGVVTVVTVTGTSFTANSTIRFDDGQDDSADSTKSTALDDVFLNVVSVSPDGTQMQVEVDTTNSNVADFFALLAIDNGLGEAAQPFRVQGTGPIVDALLPPTPRRNETFVFSLMGNNLETAIVTPPAGVVIELQQRTEEQLTGLLSVAANAPLGEQVLLVSNNGQTISVVIDVGLPLPGGTQEEDLLKGTAIAQRARDAGQPVPTLFMQRAAFSERFIEKTSSVQDPSTKGIGCGFLTGHWPIFSDTLQIMVTFDPNTGIIGPIATSLGLGSSVAVRAYTFSIALTVDFFFDWLYCPGSGFGSFRGCLQLEIEAEVPGGRWERLFLNCFGPDESEEGDSTGETSRLEFLGNECVGVESELVEPGIPGFIEGTVTQLACCAGTVALESEGISFGEPYLFDLPDTVKTTPEGCTACTLRELSFDNDIRLREDFIGTLSPPANGTARAIQDPVWKDDDLDGEPEEQELVAYAGGRKPKISATFALDPPPKADLSGITVRGTASSGIEFEAGDVTIQANATEHTVTIEATSAFPKETKHYKPFEIEWSISFDGSSFQPIGVTKNEMYVTLDEPLQSLPVWRTVLAIAVADGDTNVGEVFDPIWKSFQGPANTKNWEEKPLYYYPPDFGFGRCIFHLDPFLTGPGAGKCGAFARLFDEAMGVHGIEATRVNIRPRDEDSRMLIKEWQFGKPSHANESEYHWLIDLIVEEDGDLDMVPPNPNGVYNDMVSTDNVPGQNTHPPSEKVFTDHQVVRIPPEAAAVLGGACYVDPSYGLAYESEYDFEVKAVEGYAKHASGQPPYRFMVRKPRLDPSAPGVEFVGDVGTCTTSNPQ